VAAVLGTPRLGMGEKNKEIRGTHST